jgi:exopolysaccharide production protein ExoZ
MIGTIQALRAFAAIAVLTYHAQLVIFGVQTEFAAVPLFFCISGFIMTMVSRSSAEQFFTRRFIRVVPLYWVLTLLYWLLIYVGTSSLAALLSPGHGPGAFVKAIAIALYSADYQRLWWSLIFSGEPDGQGHVYPVMQVGWTLNLELLFYSIFALWLQLDRRLAPLLTCASLIFLCVLMRLVELPERLEFYGSEMLIYFVLGVLVYYLYQLAKRAQLRILPVSIAALFVATMYVTRFWTPIIPGAVGTYAMPALAVLMAVFLHLAGLHIKSKILLLLGDASFAIYLCQEFVLFVMWLIASRYPELSPRAPNISVSLAVIAAGITLGIATHLYLERPMLRYLRHRIGSKRNVETMTT